MSISAVSALIESGMETGGRFMVLQALAFHLRNPEPGDPKSLGEGEVKISYSSIAAHSRLGLRQVKRIIKELRGAEMIRLIGEGGSGPGDANVYALSFLDIAETVAFASKKARRTVYAGYGKALIEAGLIGWECTPENAEKVISLAADTVAAEGHDRVASIIRAVLPGPAEKGCHDDTLKGDSDKGDICDLRVTSETAKGDICDLRVTSETAKGDISCKNPFILDSKDSPDGSTAQAHESIPSIRAKLLAAAGLSEDDFHHAPDLISPIDIVRLIRPPTAPVCDLELDVLPAVQVLAARQRANGQTPRNWRYFRAAIIENRDRRLAGCPPPNSPPAGNGVRPQPSRQPQGDSLIDVAMRMSRELRERESVSAGWGGGVHHEDQPVEPGEGD